MENIRSFISKFSNYFCQLENTKYKFSGDIKSSNIHIIKSMTDSGIIYSFRIMLFDVPRIMDFGVIDNFEVEDNLCLIQCGKSKIYLLGNIYS